MPPRPMIRTFTLRLRVGDVALKMMLWPEAADERELLTNPMHLRSFLAASDLQCKPAVIPDPLHRRKNVGEVRGALAKWHGRDTASKLRAAILDVNRADA